MIVQHEIVAGQQTWQRLRRNVALFVHYHRRIVRAHDAGENRGEVVDGIHEQALHVVLPRVLTELCLRAHVASNLGPNPGARELC